MTCLCACALRSHLYLSLSTNALMYGLKTITILYTITRLESNPRNSSQNQMKM